MRTTPELMGGHGPAASRGLGHYPAQPLRGGSADGLVADAVSGISSGSNRATALKQDARFGECRVVGDVAAFTFPGGVPTAGTRHASAEHVSGQQPAASRAAVRPSVRRRSPDEADEIVVNINSHSQSHWHPSCRTWACRCANGTQRLSRIVVAWGNCRAVDFLAWLTEFARTLRGWRAGE